MAPRHYSRVGSDGIGRGIVSEHEFKRVLGYANAAIDVLARATIPPYPQFYELLYTYVTGVNPALNSRINEILRAGTADSDTVGTSGISLERSAVVTASARSLPARTLLPTA